MTSIAKFASNKLGVFICSVKFLSSEVSIYLYKCTTRFCLEYCCQDRVHAPSFYLDILDKLKKKISRTVDSSRAVPLEPLSHRRNVANLSLFFRYYFGRCLSELAQMVPLPHSRGRTIRYLI